ncbi:hypothetical protein [Pseudomonas citrulli]|uniref:Lipoprotein n=1 Tax=Pseudomonas citrulli TaxID=3064347 RepID=A0ABT9BSP5_9PSED|nr:hypothetical protein [Pseudomonas sp. K18]MDO7895575.1 hypothetical protein [Pseudomonas sp. K18]
MTKARCTVLISCLLSSMTACAGQQASPASPAAAMDQVVSMGGQTFTLVNDQQYCALRKPDQTLLPLDLPWPCQFTVDKQGKSHVETFGKVPIVIVIHLTTVDERSPECRSEYRAIRQVNGQLEPSAVARNASCMRGSGDQKNYTGLFTW